MFVIAVSTIRSSSNDDENEVNQMRKHRRSIKQKKLSGKFPKTSSSLEEEKVFEKNMKLSAVLENKSTKEVFKRFSMKEL